MGPNANGAGKHPGPPTKKTPEVIDRICAALRNGMTLGRASCAAGLHRLTAGEWAKEDPVLSGVFESARSECAERMAQIIADAAPGDWRAASWVLEHRFKEWRKPTEVTGKDGGPIQIAQSDGDIARAILAERRASRQS